MHFGQLPYDTHVCAVNFESYMEPSSEVRLLAQGGAADDPDSGISLDAASELEHTTWIVEGGRDGFASPGRMVRKWTSGYFSSVAASRHGNYTQYWDNVVGEISFRRNSHYYFARRPRPAYPRARFFRIRGRERRPSTLGASRRRRP